MKYVEAFVIHVGILLPWSVYGLHNETQYSMSRWTRMKYAEALVSMLVSSYLGLCMDSVMRHSTRCPAGQG